MNISINVRIAIDVDFIFDSTHITQYPTYIFPWYLWALLRINIFDKYKKPLDTKQARI